MTYLLDVSTIIAFLWQTHVDHAKVSAWAKGKKLADECTSYFGQARLHMKHTIDWAKLS